MYTSFWDRNCMRTINDYFEMNNIHFMDAEYINDGMLFWDTISKEFYSFDFDRYVLSCINVNGEDEFEMDCPRRIIRDAENIFLVQNNPCVVYQFKHNDIELIYQKKLVAEKFEGRVKEAFLYERKLYIVPTEAGKNAAIINIDNWNAKYCELVEGRESGNNVFNEVLFKKPYMYISYMEGSDICRINLSDGGRESFATGITEDIAGIAIKGNEIILMARGGKTVYVWDIIEGMTRVIARTDVESEDMGRIRMLNDETIVLCPVLGNRFYYIDNSTAKILPIKAVTPIHRDSNSTFTIGTVVHNGSLFIFPWAGENMVKISRYENRWEACEIPFVMKGEDYVSMLKDMHYFDQIFIEKEKIPLPEFVRIINFL